MMATSKVVLLSSSPGSSHITITPPSRTARPYSSWPPPTSPDKGWSETESFHELESFNLPSASPSGFTTAAAMLRHSSQDAALRKVLELGKDHDIQDRRAREEPKAVPRKRKRAVIRESPEVLAREPQSIATGPEVKIKRIKGSAKPEEEPNSTVKKPRAPRKSKAKDEVEARNAVGNVKDNQPPKVLDETKSIDGTSKPIKPPRKPRAKKTTELAQTKLPKGKITKATSTKSKHFHADHSCASTKCDAKITAVNEAVPQTRTEVVQAHNLGLEKALARRTQWTPTKLSCPEGRDVNETLHADLDGNPIANDGGSRRRSSFCRDFYECSPLPAQAPLNCGEGLTKRGQIELISLGNQPLAPHNLNKNANAKKAAKKLQTVTAKATEQYQPERPPPCTILQYLSQPDPADDEDSSVLKSDANVNSRKSIKESSKPTKTPKSRKAVPRVLTPENAIKAVQEQELVFGTSSQLMRDKSPELVEDVPWTIDSSLPDIREVSSRRMPSRLFKSTSNLFSRGLWDAAARDMKGSLLQVEEVDLTETPKASKQPVSWHAVDSIAEQPVNVERTPLQEPQGQVQANYAETTIAKSVAEAALRPRPKNHSPVKQPARASEPALLASATKPMPNYEGFTLARLEKAVASYGFKAIKSRGTMISVLKQCWESKERRALENLPTNTSIAGAVSKKPDEPVLPPVDPKPSPTKKRGRPAKPKDTITPASVSPPKPRGRPRKKPPEPPSLLPTTLPAPHLPPLTDPPPPRALSPFQTLPLQPKASSSSSLQTSLFPAIASAITTYPPANDPANLTWHEKILLYDPIFVEDLAAWLNTEGLNRVNVDEEVGAKTVKAWCEANSICCLMRGEGWRAKRGRKGRGVGKGRGKKGRGGGDEGGREIEGEEG